MTEQDYSHRTRLQKLGVKPGQRVSLVAIADQDLFDELAMGKVDVATRLRKKSDFIFFGAESEPDLAVLASIESSLQPAGAVWIIYPKGVKHITQAQVMAAIKSAGLVDTKVCSFSNTHTGLKAVIPVARRNSPIK